MTDEDVCRYLRLAKRKSFILLHSGLDWKEGYAAELEYIDQELAPYRSAIDCIHKAREGGMGQQSHDGGSGYIERIRELGLMG